MVLLENGHRAYRKQAQNMPQVGTEYATSRHRACHKQAQNIPQTGAEYATSA